ncbi:MAG: hypothetical protein ACXIUL_03255 [Wenzhouxiangella sp.]
MKGPLHWLAMQFTDALAVYLIPLTGALLPARLCKSLIWRLAGWAWLLPDRSRWIDHAESVYLGSQGRLAREWRWMHFMESAEYARLILGLPARLEVDGQWPDRPGFMAVGMHLGAGITALWHLKRLGLSPRLIYRPVRPEDLPGRPLLYWFHRLRLRLMVKLCPAGPIGTGGARQEILEAIQSGRSVPMIIADTPSPRPDAPMIRVGQRHLGLRQGVFSLIEESASPVVFFVTTFCPHSGKTRLVIDPVDAQPGASQRLLARMEHLLAQTPGQWHLWPALGQH